MQLRDLMQLFREGQNEGRKKGYVTQGACDAEGVTAVVLALRDELAPPEWLAGEGTLIRVGRLREMFNKILGDAEEKAEFSANKGEENGLRRNRNGFRDGAERAESGPKGNQIGLERQGDVSVSRGRLDVRGESRSAEHPVTDGDSGELQGAHRHEDGGRPVCSLGGVTERLAGGRLDDSQVVSEKAAGGSTSDASKAIGEGGALSVPGTPTPATDPVLYSPALKRFVTHTDAAPAVCVWTHKESWIGEGVAGEAGCDGERRFRRRKRNCPSCGKPIKFTEAK